MFFVQRALVVGLMCATAGSAMAADPMLEASAAQPAWMGVFEMGGLGRYAVENEGGLLEYDDTVIGAYGSMAVWGQMDSIRFGLDGYLEVVELEGVSADDSLTPGYIGVVGAHVGSTFDSAYLGAFGAAGFYPEGGNEEQMTGYAVGVEGTVDAGMATLFGKVGYAEAGSDEYPDDDLEGFVGPFVEAGAVFALSEDFALMVSGGYGYSENFDGTGESGGYASWGSKLAYSLPTEFALNLTAAYEGYYAYTETADDDETIEHTFKMGLSIPFGGTTASESLDPLATPVGPFRAAYSSDAL